MSRIDVVPAKMSLKEKREEWEKGGTVVLKVSVGNTIYVVLNFNGELALHRYFLMGKSWEVSVDISNSTLDNCLAGVTEAFEDFYPN